MSPAHATTVVNGGTGDYALEAILFGVGFILGPFLILALADRIQRALDRRRPLAPVLHLPAPRPAAAVSPDRCRACGSRGWHEQGCGALDRLDAPGRSHR